MRAGSSLEILAGRRCRRVLAGWLAGDDVEGVPVLRAAEGVPVSFGLLETEDVQAVEQRLDLVPGGAMWHRAGYCRLDVALGRRGRGLARDA